MLRRDDEGAFGSGTGAELALGPRSPRGSYEPMWMGLGELLSLDARPALLFTALSDRGIDDLARSPLQLHERR